MRLDRTRRTAKRLAISLVWAHAKPLVLGVTHWLFYCVYGCQGLRKWRLRVLSRWLLAITATLDSLREIASSQCVLLVVLSLVFWLCLLLLLVLIL